MDLLEWKDFIGGCVSGVAGVVSGQPLDTIKVRLQTQSGTGKYTGIRDCAWKMIKQEGGLSLFKGMSSPLAGLTFLNAMVFFTYGKTKEILKTQGYWGVFLAGCSAGCSSCVIATPIELVKVRVQSNENRVSEGSLRTARRILKEEGLFRGIYRGFGVTAVKEIPSYGIYFLTYEFCKNSIIDLLLPMTSTSKNNDSRGSEQFIRRSAMFIAGGTAGVVSWLQCYPVDTIKSRVQADGGVKYKGGWDCAVHTWKAEGVKGFFGGFSATMYRAFLTNAVTFLTYELVVDLFHFYSKGLDDTANNPPPPIHPT